MQALDNDQLIGAINSELSRATDYSNSTLKENRGKAWNYFLNRERGDEMAGRSTVQDTSVRDVIHALMAQIMPAYSGDSIISFEAFGANDVDTAEAESAAVNNLFTETNQGFLELSSAVHDCLLFRNGIVKVWVDDREEVTTRAFRAAPADVLAQAPPDQEWEHTETDENGVSHFKVTAQTQRLKTKAIEPAYIFIDPNQDDQDISEADFIGELVYFTRSELVQMDIPRSIVDELPDTPDKTNVSATGSNVDIVAKFIDGVADYIGATTHDRQSVECYWVHMMIDRDGDGISEKWRFLVSNNKLLLDDTVEYFPYASGTGWPVPHRWSGLSVYDLNRITQDERTNARRQLADNLNIANNQRPVYDPGTTEAEDITNGAPGRGIRSKEPGNVGWMPIQDIVSNSVSFLQYMDTVRSEQTGAALDMQSADGQLLSTASGISAEMQLAPRELMAAHVSRNIAETLVRNIFLLIHKTLRMQWHKPIMYSKAGDWQETNPSEWQPRTRLNVNVGLSPGERRRKSSALQFVMQLQMQMIQGGTANITTDLNGVITAIRDWMVSVELDAGQEYFLDPDGQKSQAGQQAQAQQSQAQQQQEGQMQQMQMQLLAMEKKIEEQKLNEDQRQHDTELEFKYWKELLEADQEDAKADAGSDQSAQTANSGNGAGRAN